jgi:ABC-type multidrug transport system ATPase subunit
MGVVTGEMLIDGRPLPKSFQRSTGYVEQLDVHESTSTVREALQFSALLRQPSETPLSEKYAYVEKIIKLLEMEEIAEAMIGQSGAGLTVEQRKRVTIGVELASKPQLLLFLDEPTSGLDAQSAFNIVRFLRKLCDAGQAILCTIHQPSAILFGHFDDLLLLQAGGRTVYFGELGDDCQTLIQYLERNGAPKCQKDRNPAEYVTWNNADVGICLMRLVLVRRRGRNSIGDSCGQNRRSVRLSAWRLRKFPKRGRTRKSRDL